jgi:hypothetical protein
VKKLKRYEELFELKKEREKANEDPVERLQVSLRIVRFVEQC